jgi:hypothetical protein
MMKEAVLKLMHDFVQCPKQARDYDDFLQGKIELARAQIANGQTATHEAVQARFAARRAGVLSNTGQIGF